MQRYHEPVLLREVIEALNVKKDSWYLDCTLGDGGHSLEILRLGGNVLGLDVDPQAITRAKERLRKVGGLGKFIAVQGNFRDLKKLIFKQMDLADQKFAGILFDLGVSSLQLETPQRGFSFGKEGSLDMRMDSTLEVKALDLVNGLNKGELYELFNKLGEEKYSRAISDALVLAREIKGDRLQGTGVRTTIELAGLIERVVGRKKGGIHPATRVFQALRIAVNDELNALREGLPESLEVIKNGGHILVISYHSLEDRIAKIAFKEWQDQGFGQILTKKPIVAGVDEIRYNPRSRSAKMRVFKKASYHDNHQEVRSRRRTKKVSQKVFFSDNPKFIHPDYCRNLGC